jgi:hypothetical protein
MEKISVLGYIDIQAKKKLITLFLALQCFAVQRRPHNVIH